MNLKNIELLKECRNQQEMKELFKGLDMNITSKELDELKANLTQNNENCSALNYDQLDEVAGGMLELSAHYRVGSPLTFQKRIIQGLVNCIRINVTYDELTPQGPRRKNFTSYLQPGSLISILSETAQDNESTYRYFDPNSIPMLPQNVASAIFNGIRNVYLYNEIRNGITSGNLISKIDYAGNITISPIGGVEKTYNIGGVETADRPTFSPR